MCSQLCSLVRAGLGDMLRQAKLAKKKANRVDYYAVRRAGECGWCCCWHACRAERFQLAATAAER